MTAGFPPTPGLFDEHGVIAVDHECKRCSYNLRGLREDGRCPECGTPIGLSATGDLLRFADPEWVSTVARGLTIILWMILVGIIVGAFAAALEAMETPEVVGTALGFLAQLVGYYGVWLMTKPDPSGIGEDPYITARKVIRITLVVELVSSALETLVVGLPFPPTALIIIGVIMVITAIIGLIGEFAKFVYYEKLAARIPDDALARRARFLKWAFTVTFGVMAVGSGLAALAMALAPGAGPPAGIGVLGCLMAPVGIAFIVFAVMTLFLLLRLRRAISEQARIAQATWAAALRDVESER
jgi:hypothetical protein